MCCSGNEPLKVHRERNSSEFNTFHCKTKCWSQKFEKAFFSCLKSFIFNAKPCSSTIKIRQSHFLSLPNKIEEDKSSSGEFFKQLYTGFLCLCPLLWLGPPPSSSQLHPHIMCHATLKHKMEFIAQTTFLTHEQPDRPSEGVSAAESPG